MIGAHMSIAGGLPLACERAAALGCDTMQIFTKNERQWRARPIPDEEAAAFRKAVEGIEQDVGPNATQPDACYAQGYGWLTYAKALGQAGQDARPALKNAELWMGQAIDHRLEGPLAFAQHAMIGGAIGDRAGAIRDGEEAAGRARNDAERQSFQRNAEQLRGP